LCVVACHYPVLFRFGRNKLVLVHRCAPEVLYFLAGESCSIVQLLVTSHKFWHSAGPVSSLAQMPVTRSATRATPAIIGALTSASAKRKAIASSPSSTSKAKKPKHSIPEQPVVEGALDSVLPKAPLSDRDNDQPMVDLVLDFSFEDAKAHLINVDPRFAELFKRLKCKPFQHLEQVHPFRCVFGRRQS